MKELIKQLQMEIMIAIRNEGIVAVATSYGLEPTDHTESELIDVCVSTELGNYFS